MHYQVDDHSHHIACCFDEVRMCFDPVFKVVRKASVFHFSLIRVRRLPESKFALLRQFFL